MELMKATNNASQYAMKYKIDSSLKNSKELVNKTCFSLSSPANASSRSARSRTLDDLSVNKYINSHRTMTIANYSK